jgi:hypothetical protein
MKTLIKIAGILLIALGTLFFAAAVSTIYNHMILPTEKTGDPDFDNGQIFGFWLCLTFYLVVIFFMFKFGLKLLKRKTKNFKSINEIGREN